MHRSSRFISDPTDESANLPAPSTWRPVPLWLDPSPRRQHPHAAFLQEVRWTVYRNEDTDGGHGLTARRLFKFPQMDFEMAIWEMTSLLIAPKKVFKSIYYHVSAGYYWMGPRTGQDC